MPLVSPFRLKVNSSRDIQMFLRGGTVIIRSNPIVAEPRVIKIIRTLRETGLSVTAIGWDRKTTLKHPEKNFGDCTLHLFGMKAPVGTPLISVFLPLWWLYVFVTTLTKSGVILHPCDFDALVPSLFIKIFTRRKLVYDIFDFYADRLLRGHPLEKCSVFWKNFSPDLQMSSYWLMISGQTK